MRSRSAKLMNLHDKVAEIKATFDARKKLDDAKLFCKNTYHNDADLTPVQKTGKQIIT